MIFFSNVIEGLNHKYTSFWEKLEYCDTEIFLTIPMVMLLRKLNDEDFNICQHFLPEIDKEESHSYKELKKMKEIL